MTKIENIEPIKILAQISNMGKTDVVQRIAKNLFTNNLCRQYGKIKHPEEHLQMSLHFLTGDKVITINADATKPKFEEDGFGFELLMIISKMLINKENITFTAICNYCSHKKNCPIR